eukprot:GDKI01036727.1.p1 GENE.GDKI01036727.1~~GDKI01036727.1.p1  ORF type:complete len:415 (+),score=73.90 GDKI01036727.1:174-1418(+)
MKKSFDLGSNQEREHKRNVELSVGFYFVISIGIVFFNYMLLTSTFKHPVFVSWAQQVVGLMIIISCGELGKYIPTLRRFFPQYAFDPLVAWHVLPVAVSFVVMIAFSNTCLKYVQVSTYQVARSTTIMFNILLSYLILAQHTSLKCIFACAVVVLGFVVGSLDPSALTFLGVAAGLLSSVAQAVNNVLVKRSLPYVDGNQNVLLSYNLTMAIVLFLPCIWVAGEWEAFYSLPWNLRDPRAVQVWGALFLSGILAILVNIATFLVIKFTNPVTFNMVGLVKSCVQTVGGVMVFGEVLSLQSLIGILLSVVGSYGYGKFKLEESQAAGLHALQAVAPPLHDLKIVTEQLQITTTKQAQDTSGPLNQETMREDETATPVSSMHSYDGDDDIEMGGVGRGGCGAASGVEMRESPRSKR